MNGRNAAMVLAVGAAVALAALAARGKAETQKDKTSKTSESTVVTNDNGSVTKSFTECTVTTNGNMVTERRRETSTTLDDEGNVLGTSTSEYATSYTTYDGPTALTPTAEGKAKDDGESAGTADSFMGLKFGEVFDGGEFASDPEEPTLLRASFKPAKTLEGFDDYYVYVTPKTHKIAKVCACAKDAVEPGTTRWRRHYLIEALEKRYQTWARPRSSFRPIWTFDIGAGRYVTACLAGASRDYETMLVGWDYSMLTVAADEKESIRRDEVKAAAEKRQKRVSDAADAF